MAGQAQWWREGRYTLIVVLSSHACLIIMSPFATSKCNLKLLIMSFPDQDLLGSGSTVSHSPFSARKISSGLRRTVLVSSTRNANRSNVRARVTFSSAMAKFCPMQFLQGGGKLVLWMVDG